MEDIIQQFFQRDAGPLVQFIKYGIAGGIATSVDIVVFYLFAWKIIPALRPDDPVVKRLKLTVKPITEKQRSFRFILITAIAFIFSNFTAYIINILWVFTPDPDKSKWLELAQFYAVSGASVFLGTAIGWVMIKWFHMSTTASYVCKMIAALMINFVGRKFFIFKG